MYSIALWAGAFTFLRHLVGEIDSRNVIKIIISFLVVTVVVTDKENTEKQIRSSTIFSTRDLSSSPPNREKSGQYFYQALLY